MNAAREDVGQETGSPARHTSVRGEEPTPTSPSLIIRRLLLEVSVEPLLVRRGLR